MLKRRVLVSTLAFGFDWFVGCLWPWAGGGRCVARTGENELADGGGETGEKGVEGLWEGSGRLAARLGALGTRRPGEPT